MANGTVILPPFDKFAGLRGFSQNLVQGLLQQQQQQRAAQQLQTLGFPGGLTSPIAQQAGIKLGLQQQEFAGREALAQAKPASLRAISTGEVTSVFDPRTGQIIPTQFPSPRVPSTTINLAPSEREAIATNLATDDALNDLRALVDANFVGPIKGTIGGIRDIFGLNTPQESEFRAATSTFRNQIIKEITGAQMSENEAKRILKQVPQEKDPPSVWLAKWKQSKKNLERIRIRRAQVQRKARVVQQRTQQIDIPADRQQFRQQPITATNSQTGERIQSFDGGKTWQPTQ